MNSIRDELLEGESKRLTTPKFKINKKYLFIFIPLFVFGWYITVLLFGTNSVIRLSELSTELENLKNSVKIIKEENAKLQKELFELKQLRGTN
ncbi:MAG: hypothetical protein OIF32_03235 [Campylobacterales bacterium]|nr:hypothetical protein [Campylobacterales bacterium]